MLKTKGTGMTRKATGEGQWQAMPGCEAVPSVTPAWWLGLSYFSWAVE